jgi:hypothetical protein
MVSVVGLRQHMYCNSGGCRKLMLSVVERRQYMISVVGSRQLVISVACRQLMVSGKMQTTTG